MKLGRNDPCHCGSGKKYKKCCQDMDEKSEVASLAKTKKTFQEDDFVPFWDVEDDSPKESGQEWEYPELSDEENRVIGEWWSLFEDMADPDEIQNHLKSFISEHPELLSYLDINLEVVFNLGSAYRTEGRFADYISFLEEYKNLCPDLFAEEEGIFNLDNIAWLINTGKSSAINTYFSPYISNPSANALTLLDLVDLLIAKDITQPLLELVDKTKEDVLNSNEFLAGDNILLPVAYDKLTPYLKQEYTEDDVLKYVREYVEVYSVDMTDLLLANWTARFKDILRPYGSWEVNPTWKRNKREDFYFSITDNYMWYLHKRFGISLISAQYHANLINDYGLIYLDMLDRKKWDKPFDFSYDMLDQIAMKISRGPFFLIDPVVSLSLLNAIFYFVDYLETCDMLAGIDKEAVKASTLSLYEDVFPNLSIAGSLAMCFETFPFWKTN